MQEALSAATVANEFILRAKRDAVTDLSHLKVQKLVYLAHGIHLAKTGEPLIRERVEVWPYGPVISPLYHILKDYRNQPIDTPVAAPELADSDRSAAKAIERAWMEYKAKSPIELSELTHQPGTPWHQCDAAKKTEIPNELIGVHFRQLDRFAAVEP